MEYVTADLAAFRELLHEWARKQLEEFSDHTGPFEITRVRVEYVDESDRIEVGIGFRHRGCTLYTWEGHPMCEVRSWSIPDEMRSTVEMLNEILALGDAIQHGA